MTPPTHFTLRLPWPGQVAFVAIGIGLIALGSLSLANFMTTGDAVRVALISLPALLVGVLIIWLAFRQRVDVSPNGIRRRGIVTIDMERGKIAALQLAIGRLTLFDGAGARVDLPPYALRSQLLRDWLTDLVIERPRIELRGNTEMLMDYLQVEEVDDGR